MKGFVIVKTSRRGANRTYTGSTWEQAGMAPPTLSSNKQRHDLFVYRNRKLAQEDAEILSKFNPVGFVVEEYIPNKI